MWVIQLLRVPAKIIALLTAAAFAVALHIPAAYADETVRIKERRVDLIYEYDKEKQYLGVEYYGSSICSRYGPNELIGIDGVPWQDSPYADIIKENITLNHSCGCFIEHHPELMEIVLDKRFNGMGSVVLRLADEGKTVSEIKQILTGGVPQPDTPRDITALKLEDLPVITWRQYDEIKEIDLSEHFKHFDFAASEIPFEGMKSIASSGMETGLKYPIVETISINGRPWQETIWAGVIAEGMTYYGEDSLFNRHPELMEIGMDPRFNGKGDEVWELFEQGKSIPEIQRALLGHGKGQSGLPAPPPDKVSVVLHLNQNTYLVARDGSWREARLDTSPISDGGRTLMPLRGVVEHFGAGIEWLAESKQIKIVHGDTAASLTLGSREAVVNGQAVGLDTPARVVNGRTLIPLRFVSEQIGMNVEWDDKTRSITIG